MPETTAGLSDFNLFVNLTANTRPSRNTTDCQTPAIDTIQSDTKAEDAENLTDIPFQEILGQHLFNLITHTTPNSSVPNAPAVESTDTKPAQTFATEASPLMAESTGIKLALASATVTNSSLPDKHLVNTIQPADVLQDTFFPYPESAMQDFVNNLIPNNGAIGGSTNANIFTPFPNALNEDAPVFPFGPFSQRESTWGPGDQKGINAPLDKQLIEMRHPDIISSIDKPFIQDMAFRNTLQKADTLTLNPSHIPETPQVLTESLINDMQQTIRHSSDNSEINIKELPESYKLLAQNLSPENKNSMPTPVITNIPKNTTEQPAESGLTKTSAASSSGPGISDISDISQSNDEWNSFGGNSQRQNSSDTPSFDAQTQRSNSDTPFPSDSQTTTSNAKSNISDFQHTIQFSQSSNAPLSSIENTKNIHHIFHNNDTPNLAHSQEDIMEQIIQKIRITTHGDRSEIKLSLNPPDLGNMKIHFTEENDEIKAKIYVESTEVKAAIENNAHYLKESASSNGIEIHKLEVYIQNNNTNKHNSFENFNANNSHKNQKESDVHQMQTEEEITNTLQTEPRVNTSHLMVDYLI